MRRSDDVDPQAGSAILLHELVHALQDQESDLTAATEGAPSSSVPLSPTPTDDWTLVGTDTLGAFATYLMLQASGNAEELALAWVGDRYLGRDRRRARSCVGVRGAGGVIAAA